jgi:hypothetical protein
MASIFFAVKTWHIMRPHRKDPMFKNRAFLVKVVSDKPVDQSADVSSTQNSSEAIALELLRETSKYAAGVTAVYFLGSTLREIAVHTAKSRIK